MSWLLQYSLSVGTECKSNSMRILTSTPLCVVPGVLGRSVIVASLLVVHRCECLLENLCNDLALGTLRTIQSVFSTYQDDDGALTK